MDCLMHFVKFIPSLTLTLYTVDHVFSGVNEEMNKQLLVNNLKNGLIFFKMI